jgi:hypothetical protein
MLARQEAEHDGRRLSLNRNRHLRRIRRLCAVPEAGLTMIVGFIYAAAALGVAVYMVAALLRPDKF